MCVCVYTFHSSLPFTHTHTRTLILRWIDVGSPPALFSSEPRQWRLLLLLPHFSDTLVSSLSTLRPLAVSRAFSPSRLAAFSAKWPRGLRKPFGTCDLFEPTVSHSLSSLFCVFGCHLPPSPHPEEPRWAFSLNSNISFIERFLKRKHFQCYRS